MKTDIKYYFRQISLFCIIDMILIFFILYIWRQSITQSIEQGLTIVCMPFILTIILARTTNGLNRFKASILAIILLVSNCVSIIVINLINPFDRIITHEDLKNGIFRDITFTILVFIPVSIILLNIFKKKSPKPKEFEKELIDDAE